MTVRSPSIPPIPPSAISCASSRAVRPAPTGTSTSGPASSGSRASPRPAPCCARPVRPNRSTRRPQGQLSESALHAARLDAAAFPGNKGERRGKHASPIAGGVHRDVLAGVRRLWCRRSRGELRRAPRARHAAAVAKREHRFRRCVAGLRTDGAHGRIRARPHLRRALQPRGHDRCASSTGGPTRRPRCRTSACSSIGAIAAAGLLAVIANGQPSFDLKASGFAANGFANHSPGLFDWQAAVHHRDRAHRDLRDRRSSARRRSVHRPGSAGLAIGLTLTPDPPDLDSRDEHVGQPGALARSGDLRRRLGDGAALDVLRRTDSRCGARRARVSHCWPTKKPRKSVRSKRKRTAA